MRRIIPPLALAAGLASALAAPAADAATLQVAPSAPDVLAIDGTCSLREAIINANDDDTTWPDCPAGSGPDTVFLPAGTYALAIPGTDEDAAVAGDLDILDDLSLVGAGPAMTTIDAAGLDRVLDVFATVSVDGVTITGGVAAGASVADASGGGIRAFGASLSLRNTTVSGNSADSGGGLSLFAGSLQARSVVVSGNAASTSGGGLFLFAASFQARSIVVSENAADYYGGGIMAAIAHDSEWRIESSTISGNQAASQGGGLYLSGGFATLVDTSVFENVAANGGGILATGTVDAQTSVVFANTAARGAGVSLIGRNGRPMIFANLFATNSSVSENLGEGIHMSVGKCELHYATVAGNTGGEFRAGEYDEGIVYLAESIVANQDLEANCLGNVEIHSWGHNLDSDGTCNLTDPTDLPNTDPMLGALQDNGGPTFTQALLPGSPAIDAIPLDDCTLTEDQRGVARPQGAGCDIGAYEVTACADGLDNDGDDLVDYPSDPGCFNASWFTEKPQCQDGINNDPGQDELIDFDGGASAGLPPSEQTDPDPKCVGKPWKHNERCGLGVELAFLLPLSMWLFGRRRRKPDARGQTGAGQPSKGKEGTMAWELAQVSLLGVVLSMAIGVAEPIQAIDCDAGQADLDLDGVADPCDNCPPSVCAEPLDCANPVITNFDPTVMTTTGGQLDSDGDGLGDVCDLDLPPWEVSAGNAQISCPECPMACAGLGCPGSRAAHYPVGVVSHLGLERACDTGVPGFADGEVTPGCHRVCNLDDDPSTPDEWCRKLDVFVWYPATGGTPVGPSYSVCETGGTKDSCEALGCVWGNDYFPGYYTSPFDLRCLAAEATLNAPLVSAASDRPLPVLFLSHGSPGGPRDYGHLAARLAESGYVVVSVSHPGDQWFETDILINDGSSYQELFTTLHGFDPVKYPLLEQNPYCNAATGAIVSALAPSLGRPNGANFSGFATKEECFANSCGVWDDATGCDAGGGTQFLLLRRDRGRDLSDVMTYFFGGELFDDQGLRSTPPPGGGWNESGQWPWADAWDSRAAVLDPGRIGVIGHSFGGVTAITLTSKASYSGYHPAGTPDWDWQRMRDTRIRAALLWAPGRIDVVPRVLAPLAVPTMIQSGVYDFLIPWSDDLPGLWDCVSPGASGTGAEDPLCSMEGLFAAAQFDAPELEAQGLVTEPADPPRFLTRLDTAGHLTFTDEEVAAFSISCPADPTQPCSCVDAASEATLGVAECTQLAGDRAKAEEIVLENALSFLNAFVADNASGWRSLGGDQYVSDEVAGFLTADWDRDAPACGLSPLLGDGVLDSLDPEPLKCNLPGTPIDVSIDIKPGRDSNAINPSRRGVISVAILTTDEFDSLTVNPDSARFGPGGAEKRRKRANLKDVDRDGDLDLLLHFRTQKTGIAPGDTEACLTGETFDGVRIFACDSVRTVRRTR